MPCYEPPMGQTERDMYKREARQEGELTGNWQRWYSWLDKEDIVAMLCDVVTMLPEGSRIHEDIARVYEIHKRGET